MIFLFHVTLSISSPALKPVLLMFRRHPSFHLVLGRTFFLFPGVSVLNTFLSMSSSSLLVSTAPRMPVPVQPSLRNHFGRLRHSSLSYLFVPDLAIVCHSAHPDIHWSIRIPFTSISVLWRFVVAHTSAPNSIAGLALFVQLAPLVLHSDNSMQESCKVIVFSGQCGCSNQLFSVA